MSSTSSLPSYTEVMDILDCAERPFLPAQSHGFICGILCATGGKTDNSWQKILLDDEITRAKREVLQLLFEISFHLISEFSFEFALLLPEDSTDLNLRSETLGSWCQGFLSGLKQYNIPIENREPSEISDTLTDLTEIAQITYGDLTSNEEDEAAYFEVVEYVRLAVLMLYHEMNTSIDPSKNNDLSKLH